MTAAHCDPQLRFLSGSGSVQAVVVITAPTPGDGVQREEEVEETSARCFDLLLVLSCDEGLSARHWCAAAVTVFWKRVVLGVTGGRPLQSSGVRMCCLHPASFRVSQ